MADREIIDAEFRVVARGWRFPWKTALWWLYCTGTAVLLDIKLPDEPGLAVFAAAMAWPVAAFAKALAGPLRSSEEAAILKAQLSGRRGPSKPK